MSSEHRCERFEHALLDPDVPIDYYDVYREVTIKVLDGGSSGLLLSFCPFCGWRFPDSLRDEWFDRLEELGIEPEDPMLPLAMRSNAWWQPKFGGERSNTPDRLGENR